MSHGVPAASRRSGPTGVLTALDALDDPDVASADAAT
jgi:hypothetical protein